MWMRDYDGSATIATSPDRLFNYLADVRHLPDYFPRALSAKADEDGELSLVLDLAGDPTEVAGWYRVDRQRRMLQWGVPEAGLQGWAAIAGDPAGCALTVCVQSLAEFDGEHTAGEVHDTVRVLQNILGRD